MTVEEITKLRRLLKTSEVEFKVAKNTLIALALESLGKSDKVPGDILKGHNCNTFWQ
jgi:ribosomal protein L10